MAVHQSAEPMGLKQMLDGMLVANRQDIHAYGAGHLNEANLYKPPNAATHKPWPSSQPDQNMTLSASKIQNGKKDNRSHREKMKQTMVNFSMGTLGHSPVQKSPRRSQKTGSQSLDVQEYPQDKSFDSKDDDGIYVEEIRLPEMMLKRTAYPRPPSLMEDRPGTLSSSPLKSEPPGWVRDHTVLRISQKHQFLPGHQELVTKREQFAKLKEFEYDVLRKQDAMEQNVLTGIKAVEHLERRLEMDLDKLQYSGYGPNFHRLQIYSNTFDDLIQESPTFGYTLKMIKREYDNYVSTLLDSQPAKHKILYEQVEQLSARGTSNPHILQFEREHVESLETEAKELLDVNERLRQELAEEERLAKLPPPEVPKRKPFMRQEEPPLELVEQVEELHATILERLDELNSLRHKLRTQNVPTSVCTHLEQCIKETEVEIQKLMSQKEYFDRNIADMTHDLEEAIGAADTTERDSRRVWKKVSAVKALGSVDSSGVPVVVDDATEDEVIDDEAKWNWYIS